MRSRSPSRSAEKSAGSSRRGGPAAPKDENVVQVSRDYRRPGTTDQDAVDALADREIGQAGHNDPDAVPLDFNWSEAVVVVPPKKKAISIRVDEDVLEFFRNEGSGYQRRMNAVLRSYMEQRRKKRA